MKKEKHLFTKWFLILLFISYTAAISLFTHTTVIDGVTYVHSHPFRPGERDTHEHCVNQLLLLEQHFNTITISDILPNINLSDFSPAVVLFYGNIREISHLTGIADNRQPRAPPRFAKQRSA